MVLEEMTREARQREVKELLYTDDLVLTGKSREQAGRMLLKWKRAIESKGINMNEEKTKIIICGSSEDEPVQSGRYPCVVYGSEVGVNSVLCTMGH